MTLHCDVLVVGAGPAGMAAAVSAARGGAHTVVLEQSGGGGGAPVAAMHRHICGLYLNGEDAPCDTLNDGIARELVGRLKALSPAATVMRMGRVHVLPFATSDWVSAFRAMMANERSLELRLNTRARAATRDGRLVTAVTADAPQGPLEFRPRIVIDCSGDGLMVQSLGLQAPEPGGEPLAGFTVRFNGLRDVDPLLPVRVPYCLTKAAEEGRLPAHLRFTVFTPGDKPGEGFCKLSVPSRRESNDDRSREEALLIHRCLAERLPSFRDAVVAAMSPAVLHRAGPRLLGYYTLTEDDVLQARKFADAAAKNAWPIEWWDPDTGPEYDYVPPGEYYEIPMACLRTSAIGNLFCAGRCISASPRALGSTRVMGPCISLGEAAGKAAANTIEHCGL
ncbi:MAG: FAD-dependent oxidoreductase [Planctomycetota bacterium]